MLVGYLRNFGEVASARARESPTGKPFSARSIASESTWAKVIVPQRSSRMYQASTQPGTVPESNESFTGSWPPLCSLYHSIVARRGAVPSFPTSLTGQRAVSTVFDLIKLSLWFFLLRAHSTAFNPGSRVVLSANWLAGHSAQHSYLSNMR